MTDLTLAVAECFRLQHVTDAGFDPSQPRDDHGRWTEGLGYREDQRRDETFARFREEAFKYDEKGLRGDSTATIGYRTPITIPVSLVANVPGRNDEKRVPGDWQYDTLLEDVNKRGFTDETPIMVMINPNGEAYINEGNTRVAVAKAKGVERISAWIDWKNGSHQVEGPWSPDKIVPQAKVKITKDYDPEQPRDERGRWTNSTAFKEWFGESKAVDEGGKPLILYHGTDADFDTFRELSHFGTQQAANERLKWGHKKPEGRNILPVYLSIQNPLEVTDDEASFPHKLERSIAAGKFKGVKPHTDGPIAAIKKAGYDGLVYENELEGAIGNKSWVIFDPSQVKSAIGNKGTFDPKSKRIIDAASEDPSGTLPLQKQFKKDMRRRWQDVRRAIADGLKTYDFTGVGDRVVPFQNWIDQVMASRVLGTGKWMHTYLDRAASMADARARGLVLDYDPEQPRDEYGRWVDVAENNPNFKEWFKGSKVKDSLGKPMVMYHGTVVWNEPGKRTGKLNGDIMEFNRMASTEIIGREEGMDTIGSWFSNRPDKKGAGMYAGRDSGAIYPVYLSIKNPWAPSSFDEFLDQMHIIAGRNPKKQNPRGLGSTTELRNELIKQGYDGMVFPLGMKVDGDEQEIWVAFHPEQIKSAIGNKGTFDPKSKRIIDADIDFMKTLQDHAVAELQGIVEAVSQQATRALANGILTRKNPTNDILKLITKIGEARSNMLISHSIMKAFSVATLEAFRAQGVETVGILPEKVPHVHVGDAARKTPQPRGKGGKFRKFTKPLSRANRRKAEKQNLMLTELGRVNVLTAEDDRVCSTCEDIADAGPYGINKAMSLIPAHINCRCVFLPVKRLPVMDYDPDQPRAPKGSDKGGEWVRENAMANYLTKTVAAHGIKSVDWFILNNGKPYFSDEGTFSGETGEPQMCYMNAGRMALDNPDLTYVEGYVSVEGIPIAHAWLLDKGGRVVDPTIRTDLKITDYFGVPFSTEYLAKAIFKNKYWGLLGPQSDKTLRNLVMGKEKNFLRDGEFDMIHNPLSAEDEAWIASKLLTMDYDPDQPRAPKGDPEGGQWVKQEGGGITENTKYHQPDQRVFDVGGDTWNKSKATQLELEYVAAKPALIEIEQNAIGKTVIGGNATTWEGVNTTTQEKVAELWKNANYAQVYSDELDNYYASGDAERDIKVHIAENESDTLLMDAIEDAGAMREDKPYPFDNAALAEAMVVSYDESSDTLLVDFSNTILNSRGAHLVSPAQGTLPGIEPQEPADFLTEEMRVELKTMARVKFNETVKDWYDNQRIDEPEHLKMTTLESLDQIWDEMSDDSKMEVLKNNYDDDTTSLQGESVIEALPTKYDPTQEAADSDSYKETQQMAHYMYGQRAQQLVRERFGEDMNPDDIVQWDNWLWGGWVGSSTSVAGIVLQKAIADEFGGRFNYKHFLSRITPKQGETTDDAIVRMARDNYGDNAFGKIRAMVRAKWETTQFMLDKADMPIMNLYRGLTLDKSLLENPNIENIEVKGVKHTKLPDVHVERNGAASTTHDVSVANNWKSMEETKITLRAVVPRTAVISVPAYGQNVHRERESVLMGTAWVGWDAYWGSAPTLENFPMKEANP